MRKVFDQKLPGQSPGAWGRQWDTSSIDESYLFARNNTYMKYIFDRYFKPGLKILEGGCGVGHYVMHYKNEGCNIVGVDFSLQVINRIKLLYPNLPVEVGNVENLKFEDGYFDAYYSGGVVEHFEEGPFKALKEAHRVLKKDGILIITVPFLNLCRRMQDFLLSIKSFLTENNVRKEAHTGNIYKITDRFEKDAINPNFSGYQFTGGEFKKILNKLGFEILFWHGCSVAWGLRIFRIIDILFRLREARGLNKVAKGAITKLNYSNRQSNPIVELVKDILIRERRDKWYLSPIVVLLQSLFGNVVVFVCRAH